MHKTDKRYIESMCIKSMDKHIKTVYIMTIPNNGQPTGQKGYNMSYNERIVNLKVTRRDVCDILRATTAVFIDFENEAKDPAVSADRRQIAAGSAKYWREFHDRIEAQLDAFDEKNGI